MTEEEIMNIQQENTRLKAEVLRMRYGVPGEYAADFDALVAAQCALGTDEEEAAAGIAERYRSLYAGTAAELTTGRPMSRPEDSGDMRSFFGLK